MIEIRSLSNYIHHGSSYLRRSYLVTVITAYIVIEVILVIIIINTITITIIIIIIRSVVVVVVVGSEWKFLEAFDEKTLENRMSSSGFHIYYISIDGG